jgi:hypothetical protein
MADETRQQIFTIAPSPQFLNPRRFLPDIQAEESDVPLSTSYLGTPIYSSLDFKALSGRDLDNLSPDQEKIVEEGIELTEILLTVTQSKNIVRTALNGRNGTVKEYIANGDYFINVEGLIVSEQPLKKPTEAVKALQTFLELKQSLDIGSEFLSSLGITQVVVDDYRIAEVQGSVNQYSLRITLSSDTEFKIEPTDVGA